jgi:hypothetical protein
MPENVKHTSSQNVRLRVDDPSPSSEEEDPADLADLICTKSVSARIKPR